MQAEIVEGLSQSSGGRNGKQELCLESVCEIKWACFGHWVDDGGKRLEGAMAWVVLSPTTKVDSAGIVVSREE